MTSLCTCGGKPGEFCGREVDSIAPVCWGQWCRPCAELHTWNKGAPCPKCQPPKAAVSDKDQRIAALEARLDDLHVKVSVAEDEASALRVRLAESEAERLANHDDRAKWQAEFRAVRAALEDKRVERWHETRDAVAGGLAGHPNAGMFRTPAALMAAAANYADAAHGPLTPDAPKGEVKP